MAKGTHAEVLSDVRKQLAEIFDNSGQSIYIYLDEENKVCNNRFATLLGYKSADEWASVKEDFAETFVSPKDRQVLVSAYQSAMDKLVGSTINLKWRKKGGGEVPTTTIVVPIIQGGHRMALHFVSPP
jgi:PAS domain S-box-containing protein